MDVELICPFKSGVINPADMFHVIAVKGVVLALLLPGDLVSPLNAMLRLSGDSGNGAKGNSRSRSMHI